MRRYSVQVRVTRVQTFVVEMDSDTALQAESAASRHEPPASASIEHRVEADVLRQVSGPWVYGWSGDDPGNSYLGRPDGYLETKDVLVFHIACGHVFTDADVALLRSRVESAVGPVDRHWNGVRCATLSIKTKTPFGALSDAQVAAIMGPR